MRSSTLAFLLALPGVSFAQTTVTVHLPAGDCVAFASKGPASAPPTNLEAPKNDVATVPIEAGQDTLYVWARAFNKVASAGVKGTEWSPRTVDLDRLAQVVVDVKGAGGPVAAANVDLNDGKRTQTLLLDPSAKGELTFFDVKPGSLKVTVHYRSGGKDAEPVTQIFEAKADADTPPHFAVALPGAVETVGMAAPTADAKGAPAAPAGAAPATKPESSGGFNPVGLLFALILGGGAAAGIWYFIKKNPDSVGGTLERLGAQLPKSGDDPLSDPPVAAAPAPIRPEPPQKIVLDPVAPIQLDAPVAVAVAPISLGAVALGEPTLVSDAGIPIPLGEGETVVGREVGLGLSLAGETTVSRRHARLVRSGGEVTLVDEGSTNGTFVNGQKVSGSTALRPGDAVQFGSVRFRYEG